MKQLDLIQSKYRTQLQDYANKHPEYGCMESIWHAIYHADPDRNRHIHTRWLVSRTLDETILWEDIASGSNSKVYTILKRFLAIRKHLSPEQRDLYRYRDLPSVTEAIRPYEDVVTPGEMEQALRERVDRNTVVLYEGNGYKVLVPMSEEASCYWGRGTEWCTAATKSDNMFQYYHEKGPLMICILPDGKKVQFHKNSQPMDENDQALKDIMAPILVQICTLYGKIEPIHEAQRNREMCLQDVKKNGDALLYVPEHLRDKELCLESVKKNGLALGYVPDTLRDKEMCMEAVKQNGFSLCYVLKELRDRDICLTAVRQNGWALQEVPEKMRDKKMILESVKSDGCSLEYVLEELRDRENA